MWSWSETFELEKDHIEWWLPDVFGTHNSELVPEGDLYHREWTPISITLVAYKGFFVLQISIILTHKLKKVWHS